METLYVICPNKNISNRLNDMYNSFSKNFKSVKLIDKFNKELHLKNKKILFLLQLGVSGFDLELLKFFNEILCETDNTFFQGSTAALLVHSPSAVSTKRAAQDIIFLANNLGCAFIGHPIIEATLDLKNFLTWQKSLNINLEEICLQLTYRLGHRLLEYKNEKIENPKIIVLYSSPHKVSNTLDLWHMISDNLKNYNVEEIQIENGKILDCKGCNFKLCLHYGKQNSCFYGGFIVENVLPAIEKADAIVWLCPNYNDAIPANLTAVINRLTVLYHKISFHNKSMFGVVVSGNSGSDSVAKQLIGAININKGFFLPPYAVITETANDPKSIFKVENIDLKTKMFAANLKQWL